MNIKPYLFLGVLFILVIFWGDRIGAEPQPNQPLPLFLSGEAPPLVMLVMERDHSLYYEAYHDASDLNGDGVPDAGYKPEIDYYGYFDCYKCYEYRPAASQFEPVSVTPDKRCPGRWSGDFLNYLSMSRMDCLRKVLYGGYRSTDTETETVLQRAFIPQDGHSWGKEYESIERNGYDIRSYTPLSLPEDGTRHLFANTTLSDNGLPLLRVLTNSTYRIWEWVSIERPVAGTRCLNGTSGPECAHERAAVWEVVPESMLQNLTMTTYNITEYASYPASHEEYDSLVTAYAIEARKLGAGSVAAINGAGNPFSTQQDNYMTIFNGQLLVPRSGAYAFAVDGSDAVELIVDGTVVAGWYGAHTACTCTTHSGSVFLTAGTHSLVFRHQDTTGEDGYYLSWQRVIPASTMTDYVVRVKAGVAALPETNCKKYPAGVYKPVGLLQQYGEPERMYFGLMTGSYAKNISGGVLRKNIGSVKDEIDARTGQFTAVNGIIKTLDRLRIYGFRYSDYTYEPGWPEAWIATRPMSEGEQRNWGNPIAEIMYETLRYFAGKQGPTPDFDYSGTTDDTSLGLPKAAWKDPYNTTDGFSSCAKPVMLVLSSIAPSYDSDQLPGAAFGSFSGDVTGLQVSTLANIISAAEAVPGSYLVGQAGSNYDGACTAKNVNGFGTIRGLCPNDPTRQGSFYSAAVAYAGLQEDVNPKAQNEQKMATFAVGLPSPLPQIQIPVGSNRVTLVPFAKSVGGCMGVTPEQGAFQPTNTLVDLYVEEVGADHGRFRISFEDVEQGADHDMDATAVYEYRVSGNAVTITVDSEYAGSCLIQHLGYILSGTTEDGTYLLVRDQDTAEASDVNYFLDVPQHAGTALPLISSRTFTAGNTAGAGLLQSPLWYAAKWGGFEDRNKNNIPDDPKEWDDDNNGVPDNYFYGDTLLQLEEHLNKSFAAMTQQTAAGSAASIWSTAGEGDGMMLQAFFKPRVTDESGQHDITWAGYLQSLWIDSYGNLREDTVPDCQMNTAEDRIIEYVQDTDTGDTRVKRYPIDVTNPYQKNGTPETLPLEKLQPIWEAGKKLWARSSGERRIYTYTDQFIEFSTNNAAALQPYLALRGDQEYRTLGTTLEDRTANVINFIRGAADNAPEYRGNPALRKRDLTIDNETHPWLLGDIMYSTPVSISKPVEQYGLLYDDASYRAFYETYRGRETVVYVGANDGMLHAFSAGHYNAAQKQFTAGATVGIGEELWAYIPQCLLPHLKWLALPSYSHLSYVDLKPKVVDARIFNSDAAHPNGWGTLLLCGMNMGGKPVTVLDDAFAGGSKSFSSSYAVLDITDPAQPPALLWEKSFDGLGFTTAAPCVVKVHDKWLCVLASGPTDYDGASTHPGRLYIVDLRTGALQSQKDFPGWFQTKEQNAFMNSPVALDKGLNYSVDAVYAGASYPDADGSWRGTVYKLAIPITNGTYTEGTKAAYELNPAKWKWSVLFDAPAPLSAPFALSVDNRDSVWIYAGTGRYVAYADKDSRSQQASQLNYLYGIKDTFYNNASPQKSTCFHLYPEDVENLNCKLSTANLFDADPYRIKTGGSVEVLTGGDATITTFDKLVEKVRTKDGWFRMLTATVPSERVLNKPALFGGMALFPAFTPATDACAYSGTSSLYALYFETGTAFSKATLINPTDKQGPYINETIDLGSGLASSITIHAGKQEGGALYLQQSTGVITRVDIIPANNVKSGPVYWKERR